jgi:hypothetical protein
LLRDATIGWRSFHDGNPQTLNRWVWESGMIARCNAFDFATRFTLAAMCNSASRFDTIQLDHLGLAANVKGI